MLEVAGDAQYDCCQYNLTNLLGDIRIFFELLTNVAQSGDGGISDGKITVRSVICQIFN